MNSFFRLFVLNLPAGIEAVVATSDLQGREGPGTEPKNSRLLGQAVAEEIELLSSLRELPPLANTGVILAGDLYAREGLDRRGGSGDAREVWRGFAERCRWVSGVAGNHDLFGNTPSVPDFKAFLKSDGNVHFRRKRCGRSIASAALSDREKAFSAIRVPFGLW